MEYLAVLRVGRNFKRCTVARFGHGGYIAGLQGVTLGVPPLDNVVDLTEATTQLKLGRCTGGSRLISHVEVGDVKRSFSEGNSREVYVVCVVPVHERVRSRCPSQVLARVHKHRLSKRRVGGDNVAVCISHPHVEVVRIVVLTEVDGVLTILVNNRVARLCKIVLILQHLLGSRCALLSREAPNLIISLNSSVAQHRGPNGRARSNRILRILGCTGQKLIFKVSVRLKPNLAGDFTRGNDCRSDELVFRGFDQVVRLHIVIRRFVEPNTRLCSVRSGACTTREVSEALTRTPSVSERSVTRRTTQLTKFITGFRVHKIFAPNAVALRSRSNKLVLLTSTIRPRRKLKGIDALTSTLQVMRDSGVNRRDGAIRVNPLKIYLLISRNRLEAIPRRSQLCGLNRVNNLSSTGHDILTNPQGVSKVRGPSHLTACNSICVDDFCIPCGFRGRSILSLSNRSSLRSSNRVHERCNQRNRERGSSNRGSTTAYSAVEVLHLHEEVLSLGNLENGPEQPLTALDYSGCPRIRLDSS